MSTDQPDLAEAPESNFVMQRPEATKEPFFDPERDKLYTTRQVAEMFSVKQVTVREWINSGKLPAIRIGSGHLRVIERELRKFASHRFNFNEDRDSIVEG